MRSSEGLGTPSGTLVSMSIVLDMHQDEHTYHDAIKFDPDRWLHALGEKVKLMERNFVPFGRGTRVCAVSKYVPTSYPQVYTLCSPFLSHSCHSIAMHFCAYSLAQAEIYMTCAAVFGGNAANGVNYELKFFGARDDDL